IRLIKSTVDRVLAESSPGTGGERRNTAQRLRQEIAEITGDVDTAVRLLSEQLPSLDARVRIVRVLRAAGRHNEAIAYAAAAQVPDADDTQRDCVAEPTEPTESETV